jgi:hypothetical protein
MSVSEWGMKWGFCLVSLGFRSFSDALRGIRFRLYVFDKAAIGNQQISFRDLGR